MDASILARVLWVAGAYLAGSLPSSAVVASLRDADWMAAHADRRWGEADAHILLAKRVGKGPAGVAAAADVLKGLFFVLAAREIGHLPAGWLAAVAVAVVVGHGWPFYAWEMAGRGISATAGVYLVLLPIPMVIMGSLILAGIFVGVSGVATTVGLVLVPPVAALQGQPAAFVAMSASILGLVLLRRLEGVRAVVRRGVPLGRAVWYRLVYDSSGPPGRRIYEEAVEGERSPEAREADS